MIDFRDESGNVTYENLESDRLKRSQDPSQVLISI